MRKQLVNQVARRKWIFTSVACQNLLLFEGKSHVSKFVFTGRQTRIVDFAVVVLKLNTAHTCHQKIYSDHQREVMLME